MKPVLSAMLSVQGTVLSDDEKRLFETFNPLGVALFSRNVETPTQLQKLISDIKQAIARDDVLIGLDEEGGRVNRLEKAGFGKYASQGLLSKTDDEHIVEMHAALMAFDMKSVGANLNFAPVVDVEYEQTTKALKTRMFGSDRKKVAHFGRVMWQTYFNEGICPCIKHIPGHGLAQNDPHLELPVIEAPIETMAADFYPFEQNKDCPAAMTAHILIKAVDGQNPVTFSKKAIAEIVRGKIDYQGFLFSDSIDMHALKGSMAERTLAALDAGCDAVCYCMGKLDEMNEICALNKYLEDKALERLEKIKSVFSRQKCQTNLDFIRKKYYAMLNLFAEEKIDYDATEVLFELEKGEK
ncbi:MAG: beta-N-acetylhexosaminidase [Alphaproteobacteria bacterium]|nr:beta-N-acetylhexosaminidase [Alphaproteobacteria bacterium]